MKLSQLLLFQCLIVGVHHSAVAPSTQLSTPDAQFSFALRHSEETSTGGSIECPSVWYKYYNSTTGDCQCIPLPSVICGGEYAYANIHHILTYNADKEIITELKMRHSYLSGYNTTQGGWYTIMPNSISELNRYMCDPLNRKDYMCKECKNGYGPAVIFQSVLCASMCYSCGEICYSIYLSRSFRSLYSIFSFSYFR